MQQNTDTPQSPNSATDPSSMSHEQWHDHLAKLAEYGEQMYSDYRDQASTCRDLAQAEWRLSTRSLALTIILLVSFAGGLVLLWAGLLATLGLVIFSFSGSIWLSAASLIVLQLLCLVWLWRNISYVSNKIGFSNTTRGIKQLFNIAKV